MAFFLNKKKIQLALNDAFPTACAKWIQPENQTVCMAIYTIYPLLRCQTSSGSMLRASDQNLEEPRLNLNFRFKV